MVLNMRYSCRLLLPAMEPGELLGKGKAPGDCKMREISLAKTAPLRPFKTNVREKELIKSLFYKL